MSNRNIKLNEVGSKGFKNHSPSTLITVIAICLLGVLVYSNTFHSSFHFDDTQNIVTNYAIRNISNLRTIWDFCPTRFFTFLSLASNYHFHKLSLPGYHLFNLAVHIGGALLVRWLIILTLSTPVMKNSPLIKYAPLISFFAGLIFVSHPVQTQAVTYIIQRAASLAAFFYLFSLCLYAKARLAQNEKLKLSRWRIYYAGSVLTAVLALFTKENTVTLPFLFLFYELSFFRFDKKTTVKHLLPFFLILLAVIVTMRSTGSVKFSEMKNLNEENTPSSIISPRQYLLTQFRVIVTYLRLLLIPVNQNLDYDYPLSQTLFNLPTLASLCLLTLFLITAVLLFRKERLISFSIFWFFLTLMPESSIIPISDVIFEHRLYLPMVGYCIFLPATGYYLFGGKRLKPVIYNTLLAIVICYSALTYVRNQVWKDDSTLWNDTVNKSPNKARPHYNRGVVYRDKGDSDKAIADCNQALRINPNYAYAYNNRGAAYWDKGDSDKAIADYNQALRINPNYADVYNNRGVAYKSKGDYDKAIADYNQALRINSNYADVYNNRGVAYQSKGDYDKAIADYNQALKINPNYAYAYFNRGMAYRDKGDSDKAIADCNQALRINPNYADAYYNRGVAYWDKGDSDKAIADYNQALRINPNYADVYYNRGVAYFIKKNYAKAWEDVHKVQSLGSHINPAFLEELRKASGRDK
ncbi:MAG: tetratricopeptide repeat protein [Candidatus Omnitrophota bacterium]